MSKVIGIGSAKKPDEPCPWCGKKPACHGFTCPRLSGAEGDEDGWWKVSFHPGWKPRDDEPDDAA